MDQPVVRRFLPASLVCAVLLLGMALFLTACNPLDTTMNYQGRLLRANGAPVADGNYTFRFNLYHSLSSGTPVYTETRTVSVQNGLFNASFGSGADVNDFSQPLYLGVTVNGETLSPRLALRGAPYAMSLAPGAVVQGSVPMTRTFAGHEQTGAAMTIVNSDGSATGGNGLLVANYARRPADWNFGQSPVAALRVVALGTVSTGSMGSYGAHIQSDGMRGMYVQSATDYYAGVFQSNVGIQIVGGGNCQGCTIAYPGRNVGDSPIAAGDLLAPAGVSVDADLNQPILLVRRAGPGDTPIGVAGQVMSASALASSQAGMPNGPDSLEGPAPAGGYVSVIVQGLTQVRAAPAAKIAIGDRLAAAADGAAPAAEGAAVIARALSEPNAAGLVWAMVDAR